MNCIDTDFHSHLLPDIDCSSQPDIVSELIAHMAESGVKYIVLTPHFYPHRHSSVQRFLERRENYIRQLTEKLTENGITPPHFFPAAEVLLFPGLENFEGLDKLCIENTRTLLIEMPDPPWVPALYKSLNDIRELGYDIVIAHAERYGKKEAESLIEQGLRIQINADSLCSRSSKRNCMTWIKNGHVYAIGSDTHVGRSVPSYKGMLKASSAVSDFSAQLERRMHRLIGIN